MHKKLQTIRAQIHLMLDQIFELKLTTQLPELMAKEIALQSIILSAHLSEHEIKTYLSDQDVQDYMAKHQRYCIELEIYLEQLMSEVLRKSNDTSDFIQLIRHYYASIYEMMAKNEITLANLNKQSNVCMIGIGSAPLSMLYMHRFSRANVVGLDKSAMAVESTSHFINFLADRTPERYHREALSLKAVDGSVFDYGMFDAVILSIHIENKDLVIKRILDTTQRKDKLVIIDRKVIGLSQYFYKNHPCALEQHQLQIIDSVTSGLITSQALTSNC